MACLEAMLTCNLKRLKHGRQANFIPRLSLTIDYFNIEVTDAIRTFGVDAILNNCVKNASATFTPTSCDLVNRDAAGSLWLTPGGFTVDLPNNVGRLQTSGIEIAGNYTVPVSFGTVSLSMNGTYLDSYEVENGLLNDDGSLVTYDCAGLYGPTCSVGGTSDAGAPLPRWRHKARVSLKTDSGFGVSAQWRFIGKVKAETISSFDALNPSGQTDHAGPGTRISSYSYIDAVLTYNLKEQFTFRLGINNLFDKEPPLVTSGGGGTPNLCPTGPCNGNTYPATYDTLGRYIFAGVTLDF